jgi:hypothetical protein
MNVLEAPERIAVSIKDQLAHFTRFPIDDTPLLWGIVKPRRGERQCCVLAM